VLTRGQLDNGRGCARLNVFRHRHEVYSGKTSSISIQTMGFDSHGNVVDGTCTRSRDYDDEDICSQSSKIVNFIDLAGDQRYIHTTAFGLSGYCPHYVMLVVSAFSGLSAMAEEHLSLARAVDLPLLLVVTKTDLATPQQLSHTLASLRAALTAPPLKKGPEPPHEIIKSSPLLVADVRKDIKKHTKKE
ncbi:Transcription factor GTP-binding domain, partial [Trinorchestia longiramus]